MISSRSSSALDAPLETAVADGRPIEASAPARPVATRQRLSGWGRYPTVDASVVEPRTLSDVHIPPRGTLVCRGEGRSYGDAAQSRSGLVVSTGRLSALCHFDPTTGVLTAEAGMTVKRMIEHVLPHGWFPSVTPGTKHVSLGGAVAADVHGKNHHHAGSIGNHVVALDLVLADGSTVQCSPQQGRDLFWATVGGMGLTGVIARVTLQLTRVETSGIVAQHFQAGDLDATMRWLADPEHDDQYTVAWIDCLSRGRRLGRSVVMRGHHATREEVPAGSLTVPSRRPLPIPFDFPTFVVTPFSVAAFNHLYYLVEGRKNRPFIASYERFFYPLDMMDHWNRLYGKRGFLQYQFMLPERYAAEGVRDILERLTRQRRGSFLGIIKRFGPGNPAPLSFPTAGYTLALDLPMTGPDVLRLLDDIDDRVLAFGGRVYLAKDARLSPARFRAMYPRLDEWLRSKAAVDPDGRFSSDLSERLGLTRTSLEHA